MRINFIMEQVKLNLIRMEKTPTRELCADMLTKANGPTEFWINMPEMLGHSRAMEEMIQLVEDDVDSTGEERSVCSTMRRTAGGGGPFEEPSAREQRRVCSAAGRTAAGEEGSVEERAKEEAKRLRSASGGGGSVAAPTQVSPSQPPPQPYTPPAPTHSLGAIGKVVTAAVSAGVTAAVAAFQQGLQQGQQQVSSAEGAAESRIRPPPPERFGEAVSTMLTEAQQQQQKRRGQRKRQQQQKQDRRDNNVCYPFKLSGRCDGGDNCKFRHSDLQTA